MNRREAVQNISLLLGGTLVGMNAFLTGCKTDTGKTEAFSQKVNAASTKQLPVNTKEKTNKGYQATTNNDNGQFNDVKRNLNSTVSRNNSINDVRTVGLKNIDKQN